MLYRLLGSQIIKDEDQETNDLDKAISLAKQLLKTNDLLKNHTVIILGAYGGRFDQEIASFHSLYKWKGIFHQIVLLCNSCSSFLLESDCKHIIHPIVGLEGPTCGLIPLAGKVNHIKTTGSSMDIIPSDTNNYHDLQ